MSRLDSYNQKELAELFGKDVRTIRRWTDSGVLPEPLHIGGSLFFLKTAIDFFLARLEKQAKDRHRKRAERRKRLKS